MNIFEIATRRAFRFPSIVGQLSTEQLWDLPLISGRARTDLNTIAIGVNNELKAQAEESFVETRSNPRRRELELMLEVIKHIIAVKQEELKVAELRAEKAEKRRKLHDAIQAAEQRELSSASTEDLLAQLAALED